MLWLLLVLAGPIVGQAVATETPEAAGPLITLEHDGQDLDGFVVYLSREGDGTVLRIDVGLPERDATSRYAFRLPVPDLGLWTVEVAAYNTVGESPRVRSDPPQFRVRNPSRDDEIFSARTGTRGREVSAEQAKDAPEKTGEDSAARDERNEGVLRRFWQLLIGADAPPSSPDHR